MAVPMEPRAALFLWLVHRVRSSGRYTRPFVRLSSLRDPILKNGCVMVGTARPPVANPIL